ncbi:MAG: hypothetical protein M3T55_04545 [Pseudomonadota bacterium]|nr:hypothetical protein [Pseudomonadota bacterium]
MTKLARPKQPTARSRVVGQRTFAAITAVEGLRLAGDSRRRVAALIASGLSPERRRVEVMKAYGSAQGGS